MEGKRSRNGHGVGYQDSYSRTFNSPENSHSQVRPKKKPTKFGHKLYPTKERNLHVMVLFNGERLCFYGATMVQCIAGECNIDGYDMKSSSFDVTKMTLVCSPHRIGKPLIFEALCNNEISVNYKHNRLRYRLKELTILYEEIMKDIGDKQPSVLVLNSKLPAAVECIHNLNETLLLPFSARQFSELEYGWFFRDSCWKLYADDSTKEIARSIEQINNKRLEGKRCSVIACAEKGAGKSTFLRHFANRNLKQELPPVYYLDSDAGQTEFNPSGCLTLYKLTEPLLSVPWAHQKSSFSSCLFLGNISPAEDIEKYLNAFEILLNEFSSKSEPGSLLIINTMGWIKGKGEEILNHILERARPDLAVLLPSNSGYYKVPSFVPKVITVRPSHLPNSFVAEIIRPQYRAERSMKGRELRDLSMIAYFASLLPRSVLSCFNEVLPYIIPFKDLIFAIPEDLSKFKDEDFFATINVQIVALCAPVNEEKMVTRHLLDRDYLPSIYIVSSSSPAIKCLGFGFIRGVDLINRKLYICSPLSPEEMNKVTVLARGEGLTVPHDFLTSQVQVKVPYLSMRSSGTGNNLVNDLYKPLQQRQGYKRAYFPCVE